MSVEKLFIKQGLNGWIKFSSGCPVMPGAHRHDELEVNLVLSGSGSYLSGYGRISMVPGTLVWLFPEQDHFLNNTSDDFRMIIGVFTRNMLEMLNESSGIYQPLSCRDPMNIRARVLPSAYADRLGRCAEELTEGEDDSLWYNKGLSFFLLSAWKYYLESENIDIPDYHPAVEKAWRILINTRGRGDIKSEADTLGLSYSRLSRIFPEQTGMSISDLKNSLRLDEFFRCYNRGRRTTMLEAALEAGFGSYSQFYRIFQRKYSVGPEDFFRKK